MAYLAPRGSTPGLGYLAPNDATSPTLTGTISVTNLTTTSYTLSWPAASDNVAVTGYDYSLNGGSTWVSLGVVLTTDIFGRTPSSVDQVRVRARDFSGNLSTPVLSLAVTLANIPDTVVPTLTGTLFVSSLMSSSYTLSWPAAADNVGIAGYDYSLDGGTTYSSVGNVRFVGVTGRTPATTDQVRVRARDAAGNFSTPVLSLAVTLPNTTLRSGFIENTNGALFLNQLTHYSWFPNGRLGSMNGIAPFEGTGTTDPATGQLTISGLPSGPGILLTCVRGVNAAADSVSYQPLAVV